MATTDPAALLRDARVSAGLTQAELAEKAGTTQSTIARLEAPGANPTVATLGRVVRAAGLRLELAAAPDRSGVDRTLIAPRLRMTPAQRAKSFEADYREVRKFVGQARRRVA